VPLPTRPASAAVDFAVLADRGWPALERVDVGGWQARFSAGVTKRANSAWPATGAGQLAADRIAEIEALYRSRGLPPAFQVPPGSSTARLLVGRGYRVVDETLLMAASVSGIAEPDADVTVADEPSDEWLAAWWAVDGRGGETESEVVRRIITGGPALYAALRADGVVVSVARLALVGKWGGLYCVATLPERRRHGYSERVVRAVLGAAAQRGVTDAWLQVLAGNAGAIALYSSRFGFSEVGRYNYLIGPLRLAPPAACRG
jgi:ribosomal protein S18 acetylase RimI-like enzyme